MDGMKGLLNAFQDRLAQAEKGTQTSFNEDDWFIYTRHFETQTCGEEIDFEINGCGANSSAADTAYVVNRADRCRIGTDEEGNRFKKGTTYTDEGITVIWESKMSKVDDKNSDAEIDQTMEAKGNAVIPVTEIDECIAAKRVTDIETMTDTVNTVEQGIQSDLPTQIDFGFQTESVNLTELGIQTESVNQADFGIQTDFDCQLCINRIKAAIKNDVAKVEADTSTVEGTLTRSPSFIYPDDHPEVFQPAIRDVEKCNADRKCLDSGIFSNPSSELEKFVPPPAHENNEIVVEEASDSDISCAESVSSDIFNRDLVIFITYVFL